MNTTRRLWTAAPAALLLMVFTGGCFNPFAPPIAPERGISEPPPVPNTPTNLLRLFEWCYNQRSIVEYGEIFTEDFRFAFSALDPAGEAYPDTWTRDDELISATQLFQGGSAEQPQASSIELRLARTFYVNPDTRPGKNGKWHKTVRTSVLLQIRTVDGDATDITGGADFFLVRGDSAQIPDDMVLRGFQPDSNRWYIERWEDDTAQPDPGALAGEASVRPGVAAFRSGQAARAPRAARPGRDHLLTRATALQDVASWGAVKAYYRFR